MANLSHSESRRSYSWWWDSHNAPKNSKWLQENITDMDGRVKSMIKLIEVDADSFARKAEMYYKKRPELMKMVEEFYRAYRALAERYNHATGELRHAHRTIAAAFPDQVPCELVEDSPSKSSAQDWEPATPEVNDSMLKVLDVDGMLENMGISVSDGGLKSRGLKQLKEMFGAKETATQGPNSVDARLRRDPKTEKDNEESTQDAVLQLSTENQNLKDKIHSETERAGRAESEVHGFTKALSDMEAEKEDILCQYQQCLERLPKIEGELSNAKVDSMRLNEKASRAEIEVQTLKEALVQLESEKNAGMVKHEEYLEKVAHLEAMASQLQQDKKALNSRTFAAETQAQKLKDEMSTLELEKEAVMCRYKECLGKISELETIISSKEDETKMLKKQAERAEIEVSELKRAVEDLNEQKEASAFQYKHCLETIAKLEKDMSIAKDEVERLKKLVLIGTSKVKTTEEKCNLLTMANHALHAEADSLAKKIAMKDQELLNKQVELEKLQSCLQYDNARHAQVEATLKTLQNLHTQSQDDQRALASELRNMLKMLDDVQASKCGLKEELQKVRDETSCSAVFMESMQNEVHSLREIKERLENEVSHHMGISISLQNEILGLKEEIELLNKSYQALVEQVEAAGLNPKCLGTSIKCLQDENSKLKQMQEQDYNEKEILLRKIENIEEVLKKKLEAEISLSDLNDELETSREKVKALQESCQLLHGEKITLIAEKASLLSQLKGITENMNCLLGQNAILEHTLSAAKVELEGLREKSKGLEEICNLLKNERSFLSSERDNLVLKLAKVERRLESMEEKFTILGKKYADLEKENETMHFQVEKLKVSLVEEKQEWIGSQLLSETRIAGLENEIHRLQEENKWKTKESEQELEKALKAQFELSILHKFIKDMENKNCSLVIECQKHVEASNLAEKVIQELESESLEQQVETELLLDEIGRLRLSIYQIFEALDSGPDSAAPEDKVKNEQTLVLHILESVEDMKCSISKHEDEKQQLSVDNLVLEALLKQLQFKGMEIELQKQDLDQEAKIMSEKLVNVKSEKEELLEMNRQLKSDACKGHQAASMLQAELASLGVKHDDLQTAYNALQEAYSRAKQENACLLKKFSDLIEEKIQVDQQNEDILLEFMAATNQSAVLKSFAVGKIVELRSLLEELNRQYDVNICLGREMNELEGKLDLQETENLAIKDAMCSLEREMQEIKECNVQMKQDIENSTESLIETKGKLFDTAMLLEATENLNSTLFSTVAELRIDIERSQHIREDLERDIIQLYETNSTQMKEIQSLHKVNKNLESERVLLHQEIEENTVREQTLSIELQGMNNEFELWEAEAATFCFDLHVSSVQEVLLKNKVQELTRECQTLEHKHAAKTSEIEQLKGKICLMENEVNRLRSQVSAYTPVIATLRDDITLIEHNALHSKLKATPNQGTEFLESSINPNEATSDTHLDDPSLLSLQDLQMRVKVVGKLVEETNKPVSRRRSNSKNKQELVIGDVDQLKVQPNLGTDKQERSSKKAFTNDSPRLQKIRGKASEVRNMILMTDIPLDQASDSPTQNKGNANSGDLMLELWETVEEGYRDQTIVESLAMSHSSKGRDTTYDQVEYIKGKSDLPSTDSDMEKELGVDKLELSSRFTEPNPELNDEIILERLYSDSEKLGSLQTALYIFRRRLETNKNSRKAENIDFETVKEQLQEAEDTLVHLVDLNVQLVKNIEECPPDEMASPRLKEIVKAWRIKVMVKAQKGSERLDMLQLAVQKIQFLLSKLDDEGKSKGKNKFLRSRTVILRDFIRNGKRNSGRRKKGLNCGCFKQSTSGTGAVRK